MTVRDVLNEAAKRIARRDAETLLLHQLGRQRAWLILHAETELEPAELEQFHALTSRRAAGEPLQHLTGVQEFFGLNLRVSPDVLIPRPETEHLVEAVLAWAAQPALPQPLRILDVGTGSGAIAIALAASLPTATIVASDISSAALDVARDNAARFQLRAQFVESDLLSAFTPETHPIPFDAIVSNPPYVPTGDAATMQPEVVDHEPHTALFAGRDGLETYRRLIPQAHAALRPGGLLALEFGFGQRDALRSLLENSSAVVSPHWRNLRFLDDYAGIPRIALAERA
jgi:release factor glutamine methyltransferase